MKVYISMDDTDNKTSIGTGKLLEKFIGEIEDMGYKRCEVISRHQLYVHENIPYTSHNSSMCTATCLNRDDIENIISYGREFLVRESAVGSDPAFCLAVEEDISDIDKLIEYGRKAKNTVLKKSDAYGLASELNIHLSEHGGTGDGVIGALAGIGLRIFGNDGRIKGKYFEGCHGQVMTAGQILDATNIDVIKTEDGGLIDDSEEILLGEKVKGVWLNSQNTLLVDPIDQEARVINKGLRWHTIPRPKIQKY